MNSGTRPKTERPVSPYLMETTVILPRNEKMSGRPAAQSGAIPRTSAAGVSKSKNEKNCKTSTLAPESQTVPTDETKTEHFALMGKFMNTLYHHDQLTDLVVHIDDYTFSAHRLALACHSEYVAEQIAAKPNQPHLVIKGVSSSAFQNVLEYIYTAEIHVTYDNVIELLSASRKLRVPMIRYLCEQQLQEITPERALSFMEPAQKHGLADLHQRTYKIVMENFTQLYTKREFLALQVDSLCSILSSDDIVITSEVDVVKAGFAWLNYMYDGRKSHIVSVITCARILLMSAKELIEASQVSSIMTSSDELFDILLRANWYRTCVEANITCTLDINVPSARTCFKQEFTDANECVCKPTPQSLPTDNKLPPKETAVMPQPYVPSTPPPTPPSLPRPPSPAAILVIGGWNPTEEDPSQTAAIMERYNSRQNCWDSLGHLPMPRVNHGVALLAGCIYVVGGFDPQSMMPEPTNTVYKYDVQKSVWTMAAPMQIARMHHQVCVLLGLMYAISGQDAEGRLLESVECYNPKTDEWSFSVNVTIPRIGAAVASHREQIFLVGGYSDMNDGEVLDAVECFNPYHDSWSCRSPTPYPCCNSCLVEVDGRLFLCGGATKSVSTQQEIITSIGAIYRYTDDSDAWRYISEMDTPRHNAGAAVIGSNIYILGGTSTLTNSALSSVECYSTKDDVWDTTVAGLTCTTVGPTCVTLPEVK